MHDIEYGENGKHEKYGIDYRARHVQLFFHGVYYKRLIFYKYYAENGYECYCYGKREKHYKRELTRGDIELIIYVEVLRVAERCEHTAEVCGDVLHNESKRHIFLLARAVQCEKSEGQKSDESHIVGYQHRADKRDIHQRDHAKARVFAELYYFASKNGKKSDISERAYHGKNGKEAGERFEIEISEIFFIRRHKKSGYTCRGECDKENSVSL
jgi:hypothetical protein